MRQRATIWVVTGALGLLAGCAKPVSEVPAGDAAEPAYSSEAAKAQALEAKAEDYKDRFAEIQASDMTPEQKAQAVGELVDEQRRAIQEAESDGGAEGNSGAP